MSKIGRSVSYKWLALVVVSMGTLISCIDMGGIRIVLPQLEHVFQTSPDIVVWVSLIWVLVGSSLMLSMGRLGDIFGRKRLNSLGLAVFTLGLIFCSISQNIIQLIISRFIQAFGAALTIAIAYAIVTTSFAAGERGKALGILSAVAGLGLLSGPALAGVLLDLLGWRSFFYLMIPVAVVSLGMSQTMLKKDPSPVSRQKFDLPGAITLFLALIGLLVAITQGQRLGWSSPWILGTGGLGILLFIAFLVAEKRIAQPVLDLKIFKNRLFSVSVASHLLLYAATVAINFLMPFYLIGALGLSASRAGLIMITIPAFTLLLSPLSGRLSDKLGTLSLCTSGMALLSFGLFLLSRLELDTSIGIIVVYLIIIGVGMGIFVTPNTSAIMGAVPGGRISSASAMIGTLRHIGMSVGLAVAGGSFAASRASHATHLTSQGLSQDIVEKLSTVKGFQSTILIALIIAGIGFITSILRGRVNRGGSASSSF